MMIFRVCFVLYLIQLTAGKGFLYIKQLLNEVEQDMRNNSGRSLCYLPKLGAGVDNTNRGLSNSSYPVRTEFNNCFIIY